MSPSDLPWWGWLLSGAVGVVVGFIVVDEHDGLKALPGLAIILAGLVCGFIGIIRFVKWVWTG
jgi:hypothetical protein